jgi:hypothetical protein
VLEGSPYALDRWDRLLSAGVRTWGFATDDSHTLEGIGWGWIQVQADSNTPDALMSAMREGRFYSSTGVILRRAVVEDGHFVVESVDADRLKFTGRWGQLLGMADAASGYYTFRGETGFESSPLDDGDGGLTARYAFRGDEGYVRCEALGRGGRAAWTQPIWTE